MVNGKTKNCKNEECWELAVRRNVGSWWLEGMLGVGS